MNAPDPTPRDFDSFFAATVGHLIAPAEKASRVAQLKQLRRAAASEASAPEERERLRAEALHLELQVDWDCVAIVYVVEHELCTHCGQESFSNGGLFAKERSRFRPVCDRMVRWAPQAIDGRLAILPKLFSFHTTRVPMCPQCAFKLGYDMPVEFPA